MAFTIDVKIALIFVIAVPLISLVIYLIMRLTFPIYKKVQSYLDRISRITRENHVGARVVRAFCRQKEESSDFMQTNDLYTKIQIAAGKISALLNPATYVIMNLAIVAILWSGSAQVDAGRITQGEVVALVNYMTQILVALLALANLIVAVTKATASGARLNEIFDTQTTLIEKESQEQHPKASENRVVFEKVTFTYAGAGAPALEDISFVAKSGETIGIIGGTGSGKTTLIHLIPRFYDIQKGEILVDKIPVDRYPFWQLREKVGMVPQHAVLFKGTVRENMRWGKSDATDEEIWEVVGQPEILIMDDSASALDFATDAALRQAIKEKTKGMTVFLVSQRAASIRQADRILVLDDGRLVGSGTHLELLENCPVYEEICLSQLSEQEVRRV